MKNQWIAVAVIVLAIVAFGAFLIVSNSLPVARVSTLATSAPRVDLTQTPPPSKAPPSPTPAPTETRAPTATTTSSWTRVPPTATPTSTGAPPTPSPVIVPASPTLIPSGLAIARPAISIENITRLSELARVDRVPPAGIVPVAWSPANKFAMTTGTGIALYDLQVLRPNLFLQSTAKEAILPAAFSSDGRLLAIMRLNLAASARELSIQILDGATAKEVRTFKNVGTAGFAFSPDGRLVAGSTQADDTGKIWEAATGKELQTLPAHISIQTFSPDSRFLVWSNASDSTLVLWDVVAQKTLRTITTPDAAFLGTVAFSPDARWITSAGNDKQLVLWDAGAGNALRVFDPKETVLSTSFSSDGRMLLTLSSQPGKNVVRAWDIVAGQELAVPPFAESVAGIALSRDGRILAVLQIRSQGDPYLSLFGIRP